MRHADAHKEPMIQMNRKNINKIGDDDDFDYLNEKNNNNNNNNSLFSIDTETSVIKSDNINDM